MIRARERLAADVALEWFLTCVYVCVRVCVCVCEREKERVCVR